MSSYTYVKLVADGEEVDLVNGKYQPQRIIANPPNYVNILVNSRSAESGDDFKFYVDLRTESMNLRDIQLCKIIFPLLPQINSHNNVLSGTHDDGNFSITLTHGYYTVQSFVNMLQAKFTAAWIALNPLNVVTVNYNSDGRNIVITDGNGDFFYFDPNCSFIKYGYNVVGFNAGVAYDSDTQTSINLTMVYSRYITVRSNRLIENQRSYSLVSNLGSGNIIAIIDITEGYGADQYINGSTFPATAKVFNTTDIAPVINICNRDRSIRVIDIEILDEFGFCIDTIYRGLTELFTYPVTIWFKCAI
jgi:hypothetical protein